MNPNIKLIIVTVSLLIFASSFFFLHDIITFGMLIIISLLMASIPLTLINFFEYKKIDSYEKQFPNFLRDLAEAQQSDVDIIQAVQITSKANYGSFSKEIKKLNDQLSWNISLTKALENFRKRLKKSKIINRSVIVIQEAHRSGGNSREIMNTLSKNIEEIKELNAERFNLMRQQVSMVYAIYFIFIGIVVALIRFLIPMLSMQFGGGGSEALGLFQSMSVNPCQLCTPEAFGCISCSLYSFMSQLFGFGAWETVGAYYKSLFFTMIIIQGIFSGLVSGQIGSDSAIAGVKHSLILVFSGIVLFLLSNWVGLM